MLLALILSISCWIVWQRVGKKRGLHKATIASYCRTCSADSDTGSGLTGQPCYHSDNVRPRLVRPRALPRTRQKDNSTFKSEIRSVLRRKGTEHQQSPNTCIRETIVKKLVLSEKKSVSMASSEESRVSQCLPLSKVSVWLKNFPCRNAFSDGRQRNRIEFLSMPNCQSLCHSFTIREWGQLVLVYLMTLAWDLQELRDQLYGYAYWERVGLLREVRFLEN